MRSLIVSFAFVLGVLAPVMAQESPGLVGALAGQTGTGSSALPEDAGLPLPTSVLDPDPLGGLPRVHEPMKLSAAEVEVLARIVKGEAWPTSGFEAHVAIAAVVLNRVRSGKFPDTVKGVAHQPWQFSCYNANQRAKLYDGKIPDIALRAARAAAAGADPVSGATHYFNPHLVKPDWAKKLKFVRRIGTKEVDTHDFYR